MIPTQGNGLDAVNFRSLKESESVDISRSRSPNNEGTGDVTDKTEDAPDPFGEFNSGKLLSFIHALSTPPRDHGSDCSHIALRRRRLPFRRTLPPRPSSDRHR